MPLSNSYRYAVLAKLVIRNPKNLPVDINIPLYTLREVIDSIFDKYKKGDTKYIFSKENKQIRIKDLKYFGENNDYLCALLSISDKSAPDSCYEKFSTGETRKIEKETDEGNSITSHILFKNETSNTNSYGIMIEKNPGFSCGTVSRYLSKLMRDKRYMKEYTNRHKKQVLYRPIFEIIGHKSLTLRDALSTGILEDIEFVRFEEKNGEFDENSYIQEIKSRINYIVNRGIETDSVDGFIQDMINYCKKENYEKMFVRIKNKSVDRTEIDINLDAEMALDAHFMHNEMMNNFDKLLEQSYDQIEDSIANKMIEIANYKL